MKNPFLRTADLLGSRKLKMIEVARKWKPVARTDRPDTRDFPILIWRSEGDEGWEVWQNDRQTDNESAKTGEPFVWFSLPKEPT